MMLDHDTETAEFLASPAPLRPLAAVPEVVWLLETLLEHARTGEVRAIAGVTLNLAEEFGEFHTSSAMNDPVRFMGYLRVLQLRFERKALDNGGE